MHEWQCHLVAWLKACCVSDSRSIRPVVGFFIDNSYIATSYGYVVYIINGFLKFKRVKFYINLRSIDQSSVDRLKKASVLETFCCLLIHRFS